ncbi:TetR/AcrR family transcriptional regulator [Cryobacterium tepidiphilum]|uniref:TetR/AcrR family transcriptional regulator n=1 Tax=Cryobacterium tepidiphilum TaxID=2486026 RepID=A0A3M8LAK4_9MICO|nr:TetR/AcrR family transcriptional regulator [Cryobacterium tepidiphilum]RNE62480.1 TetR/AcrR family transcriptional regulator [Cryobacterium tepidiphilum]
MVLTDTRPTPAAVPVLVPAAPRVHARVRILGVADRLFYSEGVHTVGVDRIISEAQVTKATFYKYYRSKDSLIVAYLQGRDKRSRDFVSALEKRESSAEQRLRGVVAEISSELMDPAFRGCPFINAAAQFTEANHPVRAAVQSHREWYLMKVESLFRTLGHERAGDAADEFFLARDGAFAFANLGDPVAANAALHRAFERVLHAASA